MTSEARIEHERRRVRPRVDESGPPHGSVVGLAVGPIAEAGCCGRTVGKDANRDQALARRTGVFTADHIEKGCAHKRADDHIGEQRMQGVTQPGAAQRPLHSTGWHQAAHGSPDDLRGGIESPGRLDAPDQRLEGGELTARPSSGTHIRRVTHVRLSITGGGPAW